MYTSEEQLKLWLEGKSVHAETDQGEECCPDFSCCDSELLANVDERIKYCNAVRDGDEETHVDLCLVFLVRMLDKEGYKVETSA